MLVGHNADEGTLLRQRAVAPGASAVRVRRRSSPTSARIEEPEDVLRRYGGDLGRRSLPRRSWPGRQPGGPGPASPAARRVYRYRVDHLGAGPQLRATHTVEVPLLFGTWGDGGPGERLGGQGSGTAAVARELARAWGSFLHGHGPGWRPIATHDPTVETGVFGGRRAHHVESGPDA